MLTNGGSVTYKEVADCKLLPLKVYFNKDSLVNVLSFKQVSEIPGVKITKNKPKKDALTVHLKDENKMKFKCNEGLYYYDTNSNNHSNSKTNNYGVNLLNTVSNNKVFLLKDKSRMLKLRNNYNNVLDDRHLTLSKHIYRRT